MDEDRMLNDEILLGLIKANGGGGGGGTTNYNLLENKPQIAGTTLSGNKSLADLGIASAQSVSNITNGESINNFAGVETALDGVATALATKQNATDNNLDTDAKTIVGAINEHEGDISSLKSGLTSLDNEVNGDATVYPYADVITIEDAVPANLADCSVKIEPVQDLHGYDKPWVGGAGKNKLDPNGESGTKQDYIVTKSSDGRYSVVGGGTSEGAVPILVGTFTVKANTQYVLNGCPSGGGNESFRLDVRVNSYTIYNDVIDSGNGVSFTADADATLYVYIRFYTAYAISGTLEFAPMIRLATETDATFAPYTNLCPISGHTESVVTRVGKNLCSELESGTLNDHGLNTDRNGRVRTKYYIRVVEGQEYVVSALPSVSGKVVNIAFNGFAKDDYATYRIYDSGWLTSGSYITIPSGVKFVRCVFRYSTDENITPSSFEDVQLELGSTATPYVPYQGKTYTIALGDTIYGGTVDFDSGVMTVDRRFVEYTDGTGWQRASSDPGMWFFCYPTGSVAISADFVTDKFDVRLPQTGIFNTAWIQYAQLHIKPDTNIAPSGATAEGLEEFKTWLTNNHLQVVYPLATPTTVQLTPQQIQLLQGQNTLTASTGQISVTANGVSGSIGQVQEQVNDLQGQIDEIELPSNPSADGSNLLLATTVSGETTKSWVSESLFLKTVGGKLVDCNTETSNGIIRVLANSTNMPSGAGDGVLIVFRPATDNVCVQMFIESGGKISERINWYGTWSSWKTMAS